MRYIMMEMTNGEIKRLVPIIFPEFMCHVDISAHAQEILKGQHKAESRVISAGSVNIESRGCYGESETLKVKSGPADSRGGSNNRRG